MTAMRAPPGYTKQKPLIVQGQTYVGGEWIPGNVIAAATPQEKAAIQGRHPAQARAPQIQAPKAAEMFPTSGGSTSTIKVRPVAPTKPPAQNPQQPNTGSTATVQVRNVAPERTHAPLIGPSVPIVKTAVEAQQVAAAHVHVTGQLQSHELQAISDYRKTNQVYQINDYLRGRSGIVAKVIGLGENVKQTARALDSALAKSVVTANIKVMRGFRLETHVDPLKAFKPGSTFTDQGFVSTTLASDVADRFAVSTSQHRVVMEIDVAKGSNGYSMPRAAGEYDEAEVVLPRGAQFQVHSVEKEADGRFRVKLRYTGTSSKSVKLSTASANPTSGTEDRSGRFMWSMDDITFDPVAMSSALTEQAEDVSEHQQAASKLAAQVIDRAEAGGFVISSEIRRASLTMMRGLLKRNLAPNEFLYNFLREFRAILHRYEPVMARLASDAHLAAWLKGGRGVAELLPQLIQPPPEPPRWIMYRMPSDDAEPIVHFVIIDEAAADLAHRQLLMPEEMYAESQQGRMQGFSIANIASLDALERVRDGLVEAVVKGQSFRTFKRAFTEEFDASGLSPARMELVFRNAILTSYSRGQKFIAEQPLVQSVATFAIRAEIDDSRLTPLCKHLSHSGLQGTAIYCTADPVWRKVAPISHHFCRCSSIIISTERAAEKGIEVAKKWIMDGQRPSEDELFVPPIVIPDGMLTPSAFAAWEAWVSPWMI